MRLKKLFKGWSAFEIILLILGLTVPATIGIAFGSGVLEILAATLSVTQALLIAKGKISGYLLCLVSMILYAIVCFNNAVYGEVIMIAVSYPIILWGIRTWIKNKRIDTKKGQVVVINKISRKEVAILIASQAVMGIGYFFLLQALNTQQLVVSTILFAWSVVAAYLLARRSSLSLIAFFINDIIGIVLWALIIAGGTTSAAAVLVMPMMYLLNDGYGIFMWRKLRANQSKKQQSEVTP